MHHQVKKFMYKRKATVLRLRYSDGNNETRHTFFTVLLGKRYYFYQLSP